MDDVGADEKRTLTERICAFIREVGFEVRAEPLTGPLGLPGMTIRHGVILYDPSTDYAPGDLLHEAGHLAVCRPERRNTPELESSGADELSATAWSFAAARHLGLPTGVVFHPTSFKEEGPNLVENFDEGRYIGLPLLQLYGMTVEPRLAKPDGPPPFPHMLRWVR